jgi:signal transduction histidine kinase
MVLLINEGFDTLLGSMFPVEGAWGTFLGAIVAIRILLYALTAEAGANPLRSGKDIFIYFFTLFYFGPLGLLLVLVMQILRRTGVTTKFLNWMPKDAHNPRDMITIIMAAFLSWVLSFKWELIESFVEAFPLIPFGRIWGWVVVLFVLIINIPPREEEEEEGSSWRQVSQASVMLYAVVLVFFGIDWLYLLFVFLLLRPFLAKFNILGKAKQAFGKGKEAIAEQAKKQAEKEGMGPIARLLQAYSEKESEQDRKRLQELHDMMNERLGKVGGFVENLSEKQKIEHDVNQKEAEDIYRKLRGEIPGGGSFFFALIVALANDVILDIFTGLGFSPIISIPIDLGTLLFAGMFIFKALKVVKKQKKGALLGLLAYAFVLEIIPFISLFPGWTVSVIALRALLSRTNDFKQLEHSKEELTELRSSAVSTWHILPSMHGVLKWVAFAGIAFAILLILPSFGFDVGAKALAAQRYVSTGQMIADAQLYYRDFSQRLLGVVTKPVVWWEQQIEVFRQDAFIAQVDQSSNRKLGLFWRDLTPAEPSFQRGKTAIVWGFLYGEILNISKCFENQSNPQCIVNVRCRVKNTLEGADTTPGKLSMLDLMGSGDSVTCKFIPTIEDLYEVNFVADFEFETRSYLPVYFTDRNLALAYAFEGKDILDVAGITEKNPISTTTPGPIKLAIQIFEKMPVRVDIPLAGTGAPIGPPLEGEEIRGAVVGISLQNTWRPRGKLQKINDIEIRIPESLRLQEYKIDPRYAEQEIGESDTRSFRCILTAPDPNKILQEGAEVTLRAIKAIANYKFAITEDTDVQVKGGVAPSFTYEPAQEAAFDDYDTCPDLESTCGYESKEWCNIDSCKNLCWWEIGTIYNSCEPCIDATVACSMYPEKSQCDLDPCNAGGCVWESEKCVQKTSEQYIKWPTDAVQVTKCAVDHIKIKGTRYVYSIWPGLIEESSGTKIEIMHKTKPKRYNAEYLNLAQRLRKGGNVKTKSIIGRVTGDLTLKINKEGNDLSGKQIIELYDSAGIHPEILEDAGCS